MAEKYSVAIDGPSGAGKSTLAKAAAAALGICYVDTGAIYRTIGYGVYRRGIDPSDAGAVAAVLPDMQLEMRYDQAGLQRMMLAGALTGIVGLAGTLALVLAGPATPLGFFATVSLLGVGNGLVMPSANAGTVSVLPRLAGSASGLAGAMMIGGGAALSVFGGSLATVGAGWLVGLMLASGLLGLATTLWLMSMPRQEI